MRSSRSAPYSAARAATFAERHAIPRSTTAGLELLADRDVEAIYNALPNSLQFTNGISSIAVAAGASTSCAEDLHLSPG